MTIELREAELRAGWKHATNARAEIVEAGTQTGAAAGSGMADLAATLTDAAQDMRGVLSVVRAVIDEHTTNVDRCIARFNATDGATAGEFHGLAR